MNPFTQAPFTQANHVATHMSTLKPPFQPRTPIFSEYAETASPNKTPTRKSDDHGFSSPLSSPNNCCPATGSKGKNSGTPSPISTQPKVFSTPMNPFTQAPFTQANRVATHMSTLKLPFQPRTLIFSKYAETASPNKTPTRKSDDHGFSSPLLSPNNCCPATGNKGKYSGTPSPIATQPKVFSTPMNSFTQAPFTQANHITTHTSTLKPPFQPRTPQTPIQQPLKYYPMPHPIELEPFMSRYFYVVTVGQDVGIFSTWYANSLCSGIITNFFPQGMRQMPVSPVSLGALTPNARTGKKPTKYISGPTPKVVFKGSHMQGEFSTTQSF